MTNLDYTYQLIGGVVSLAVTAPGQAVRIVRALPGPTKKDLLAKIGIGGYKEDPLSKAIPFIAVGIALVVGYNVYSQWKG